MTSFLIVTCNKIRIICISEIGTTFIFSFQINALVSSALETSLLEFQITLYFIAFKFADSLVLFFRLKLEVYNVWSAASDLTYSLFLVLLNLDLFQYLISFECSSFIFLPERLFSVSSDFFWSYLHGNSPDEAFHNYTSNGFTSGFIVFCSFISTFRCISLVSILFWIYFFALFMKATFKN